MSLPKVIHYCWFGNGEKNELVKRCIESWKKYGEGCEIKEWNESNYDINKIPFIRDAYAAKRWSFVSDYARLDIISEYGGIYFDTDVELIRSIKPLIKGDGFIGFEQADANGRYLVNTGGGFGALPGNDVVCGMRDYYTGLSFFDVNGKENLQPCPLYNTIVFQDYGLKCNNEEQVIEHFSVYPSEYFCPVNWKTHKCQVTPNTFSIHHFDASWLSQKEKRKRKANRIIDSIIHLPNKALSSIIGENKYMALKHFIKK